MIPVFPQWFGVAAVVGLLSGTHTAIWGMYKDAVHEGFVARSFLRSILLGVVAAIGIQATVHLPLPRAAAMALLFGLAYAVERGLVEAWKTFLREQDQSKYFIPMQFSIRGVPVASRRLRVAVGVAYAAVVLALLATFARLDATHGSLSHPMRATLVGLAIGIIVAIAGGWKDAPKEGFDPIKFLRSPAVTAFYAFILAQLTSDYSLVALAAAGYERGTVETYKKFFFPTKAPGKFSGKPMLHPHMLERRKYFVPAYVMISVAAVACMTMAIP